MGWIAGLFHDVSLIDALNNNDETIEDWVYGVWSGIP